MSDRLNFYFRQRPTAEELNEGFGLLEQADRNLAADVGISGIISGAIPCAHEPIPALSIDLTGRAHAYDKEGRRIYMAAATNVDCSVDADGISTNVVGEGCERWLGVFLSFSRHDHDTRLDGHSSEINFRSDESFRVVVRQGAEGPDGTASRVPTNTSDLLICDVRRYHGKDVIHDEDIDIGRRHNFVLSRAKSIGLTPSAWKKLAAVDNVQAAVDALDNLVAQCFEAALENPTLAHIKENLRNIKSSMGKLGETLHFPRVDSSASADPPEYSMPECSLFESVQHILREVAKRLPLVGGTIEGKLRILKGILAASGEPQEVPGTCGYAFNDAPGTGMFFRNGVLELRNKGCVSLRVSPAGVAFGDSPTTHVLSNILVADCEITAPAVPANSTWTQTVPLADVSAHDRILFMQPKSEAIEESLLVRPLGCRDGGVIVAHTNFTGHIVPESKAFFDIGIARLQAWPHAI